MAEIERNNPGIAKEYARVQKTFQIRRVLFPKPTFNAQVVFAKDLTQELLPNIFRGADADGVILREAGDAYFLTSADCLCAAFYDAQANAVAALHCGRDAVVDRKRLNEGESARREHESVVDAAVELVGHKMHRDQLQAFLAAGIRPESFDHPTENHEHAEANKRLIQHIGSLGASESIMQDVSKGTIDLFALVRHQLMQHGVKREAILEDTLDTATSKDAHGHFLLHSNRRNKLMRNLVIVRFNG